MKNKSLFPRLLALRHYLFCGWFIALVFQTTSPAWCQANYTPYTFTTLAGNAGSFPGSEDGTNSAARFNHLTGIAVDSAGNLYVADTYNHTIRKVTPAGVVTTLAGLEGSTGSTNGTGSAARFNTPFGVSVDSSGNVFVADTLNYTIRKVTPTGVVTTLAGLAGNPGSADGTGSGARFNQLYGIAVDSAGNVYVADMNFTIRKVTSAGVVTTLAGRAGFSGSADGTGNAARFYYPNGLVVDSATNIYVADSANNTIRKITPMGTNWVVTTIAGLAGNIGSADGTNNAARFYAPSGVAVDSSGNLYVADGGSTIRKMTLAGTNWVVTTFAGWASTHGSADETGSAARFASPFGVVVDSVGTVFVADTYNHTIRKVTPLGSVTTLAGTSGGYGRMDGTGSAARFGNEFFNGPGSFTTYGPYSVAVDSAGNAYVADTGNHTIRRVTPAGVVTTIAGKTTFDEYGNPQGGYADGIGSTARFNKPMGVAVDASHNVYVADTYNHAIRKVSPVGTNWVVMTLAGLAGVYLPYGADGMSDTARFYFPRGVAADSVGNIFVADFRNNTIRKIAPVGTNWIVTTLAGLAGVSGTNDDTGSAARFNRPFGVAVDSADNVIVGDLLNHTIRKVTPIGTNWMVTTLVGLGGVSGTNDGNASGARFSYPSGVSLDNTGNIYVADSDNNTIRRVTLVGTNWTVTTLAGLAGPVDSVSADGTGSGARFNIPSGVALDSAGNVYVADMGNYTIRKGWPASSGVGAIIAIQPQSQTAPAGANVSLSVTATGTGQLFYQWRKNGVAISGQTNATLTLNSVGASASAGYSVVVTNAYGSVVSDTAYLSVLTDGANGNQPAQVSAPATPAKPPAVDSLVVVTHGFEPQLGGEIEWVNTMANAIQQNLTSRGLANWQVIPFQWRQSAGPLPEQALINGWILGGLKGKAWAQNGWQHVHLIGHSAGSAFVEAAAKKIGEISPSTVIHCTFLDPYLSFIRFADDEYGQNADWSDCYLTQDWTGGFTRGKLAHAHNVDVGWLDPNKKTVAYGSGQVAFSSHGWPHDFYLQTILGTAPACAGDYGFPLSQEANGWANRWGYLRGEEPTIPCGPPGAVTNPNLLRVGARLIVDSLAHALSSFGASLLGNGAFALSSSSPSFLIVANTKTGGPIIMNGGPTPQDAGGDGPAWLAVGVPVTNSVTFVQFDSAFTGTNGAQGLMTVYWNTNQIGMLDQRVAPLGLQTYRFTLPGMITNGLYTLSFRLDSFNGTTASVTVTNVMTGFAGLDQPFKLDMVRMESNNAPVLKLTGPANYSYVIESSTNLLNWTPIALLLNTNGTVTYADPAVTNSNQRFYRAVVYSYVNLTSPTLAATRQGNNLLLSWPTNFVGFTLEYVTNLPPTDWTSNSISPAIVNDRFTVTNTISDGSRFYRLKK